MKPAALGHRAHLEQGRYRIRFFFDAGSGACFWAASDPARNGFGYWIDPDALPLSEHTRADAGALIERYDTSFDGHDPAAPPCWTADECSAFDARVDIHLAFLQLACAMICLRYLGRAVANRSHQGLHETPTTRWA